MNKKVRGQSLVEFALVATVVVMLLLAFVTFWWMWHTYEALGNAAEVGAQTAAIFGGDAPEVGTAIENYFLGTRVTLPYTYTVTPAQAGVGEPLVVKVGYSDPVRVVFWDWYLPPAQALRYAERDWGW